MRVIPAIDLKAGRCVRLIEGREHSARIYDGDPVEVAVAYQHSGASLIHLIDLDAAFAFKGGGASTNRSIIARIAKELDIPVEVGGGIRSGVDISTLIEDLGARYVVLGTVAVEDPKLAADAISRYGDGIIIGIDARGSSVATKGWTVQSDVSVDSLAKSMVALGATRFIYTDIACDGKLEGPNLEMTANLARVSGVSITASGGVSSLEDITRLKVLEPLGVDSVIVGKALYENRFTLEQAIAAADGSIANVS